MSNVNGAITNRRANDGRAENPVENLVPETKSRSRWDDDDLDVDAITSQMKNASPSVRAKLVEILSEMGGPSVVTALVEALGDEATHVRREAADAIGDIGRPAGGLGGFESTESVYARLDR